MEQREERYGNPRAAPREPCSRVESRTRGEHASREEVGHERHEIRRFGVIASCKTLQRGGVAGHGEEGEQPRDLGGRA
jgi:hypothetical protein